MSPFSGFRLLVVAPALVLACFPALVAAGETSGVVFGVRPLPLGPTTRALRDADDAVGRASTAESRLRARFAEAQAARRARSGDAVGARADAASAQADALAPAGIVAPPPRAIRPVFPAEPARRP